MSTIISKKIKMDDDSDSSDNEEISNKHTNVSEIEYKAKDGMIFNAEITSDYQAHKLKVLIELLNHSIKTACFVICRDGIYLEQKDQHSKIFIKIFLSANSFNWYYYDSDEPFILGITVSKLHATFRPIKKKEKIQLYIKENNHIQLFMKTLTDPNAQTTCTVPIQTNQTREVEFPEENLYFRPSNPASDKFKNMCKSLANTSIRNTIMHVVGKDFYTKFNATEAEGLMGTEVEFASINKSKENTHVYKGSFSCDQFVRISKLAGLSPDLQIFPPKTSNSLPLMFKTKIGSLGDITICIRSKENQEEEDKKKILDYEDINITNF